MKLYARSVCMLSVAVLSVLLFFGSARARPEFSQLTGYPCSACHVSPQGGGALTPEGEEFQKQLDDLDIQVDPGLRVSTARKLVNLALYIVHLPFGVIWAGLFLYTFGPALKKRKLVIPAGPYARHLLFGMAVVLITGPFMVATRVKMMPGLFTTRFGVLLLVKIAAALVLAAATAALIWYTRVALAGRYRRLAGTVEKGTGVELSADDLLLFNGSEKRKGLVAVEGRIYDVTGRNLWRKGIHPGGHRAGHDLTGDFKGAPHGKEVFERVEPVGRLIEPDTAVRRGPMSWAVPLGTAASVIIFLVVLLWRW